MAEVLCELTDGLICSPICLGGKGGVCPHIIEAIKEFPNGFFSCISLNSLGDRVTERQPP